MPADLLLFAGASVMCSWNPVTGGGGGEGVAGESGLWLPEDHDGEVVWVQKTGQNSLWCGPLGTPLCHRCAPRAREAKQCIPTPSKASDTTGLPQTARAGLLSPQRPRP